jgi:hypothetical protein
MPTAPAAPAVPVVQPVPLGDALSIIPPTKVVGEVALYVGDQLLTVPISAEVRCEQTTFALANIEAKHNGAKLELTAAQFSAAIGVLNNQLKEKLADLAWARVQELCTKLRQDRYVDDAATKRTAAAQRRADGNELARAVITFQGLLCNNQVKMPKALGRKGVGVPEANAERGFHLLKKLGGVMNTLSGSFYQGLANEALALVKVCYPSGGPEDRSPPPPPRRRS